MIDGRLFRYWVLGTQYILPGDQPTRLSQPRPPGLKPQDPNPESRSFAAPRKLTLRAAKRVPNIRPPAVSAWQLFYLIYELIIAV